MTWILGFAERADNAGHLGPAPAPKQVLGGDRHRTDQRRTDVQSRGSTTWQDRGQAQAMGTAHRMLSWSSSAPQTGLYW